MKKKMYRAVTALLALLLCLALVGCGNTPKKPITSDGETASDSGTPNQENEENKVPSDEENRGEPDGQTSGEEVGNDDDFIDDGGDCGPYPFPVYFRNYREFAEAYQALDVSEEEFNSYYEDSTKCEALRELSRWDSLAHAREVLAMVGNIPFLLFEGTPYTMLYVEYSLTWDNAEIMYGAGDGEHWAIRGFVHDKAENGLAITAGKEKVCEFALSGDEERHITIYNGGEDWLPYFAVLEGPNYDIVFRCNEYFKGGLEKFEEVMRNARMSSYFGEMEKNAD